MSYPEKNKIFIYNIPPNSTKENLLKLFSKCGSIENITIKKNYAFISYSSHKSAEEAIRNFNNITYYGIKINVYYSNSEDKKEKPKKIENNTNFHKKINFINKNNFHNHNYNKNANNNSSLQKINLDIFDFKKRKNRFNKCRKSPDRSFNDSFSFEDI